MTLQEPNAPGSLERAGGVPLHQVLSTWRELGHAEPPAPPLLTRAHEVVSAAAAVTGLHKEAAELADALASGDPRAAGALPMLDQALASAAHALARRCAELASASRWAELQPVARLAEAAAFASRQLRENVTALITLSRAERHIGEPRAALDAATDLVALGESVSDRSLRSSGHDERARALAALGRQDEALREFALALELEDEPHGRYAILEARADVYVQLGELRAAVAERSRVLEALDAPGTSPEELAIALDNAATAVAALGDRRKAAELLRSSAKLLSDNASLSARVINALARAETFVATEDREAAARAFAEAHELAFDWARSEIEVAHYRTGFVTARATGETLPAEAGFLYLQGLQARDHAPQNALQLWTRAKQLARAAGDNAFALRVDANAAALLQRFGDVDQSAAVARDVAREAAAHGFAAVEAMAWGTLAALAGSGAELELPAGPLGALARSVVLDELQLAIIADAGLQAAEPSIAVSNTGAIQNNLGILARRSHALELAREHFDAAVARAREVDAPFELANRLGNLLDVLDRLDREAAEPIATELAELLESAAMPVHGRIAALKVLGEHTMTSDPDAAVARLTAASDAIEDLRRMLGPGAARTSTMRDFHSVYRDLSRLLRQRGDAAGAFDVLQRLKGRRLVDALNARADVNDGAVTAAEMHRLLAGGDTVVVDTVVEDAGIAAYIVSADTVVAAFAKGAVASTSDIEFGDVRERHRRLVELCLHDPLLRSFAAELDAASPADASLLIVPDGVLHNLPLHIVPIDGKPWWERRRIGEIAAAGALRFAPGVRHSTRRAIVAGDSSARMPLPHAASECADVANQLGVEPLIGPGVCTREAIERALGDGQYDVVHLAVHGRGDAHRGGRASLLLGEDEWVSFNELAALPWKAELVVFSGCSTAVSGPRHERDFLSVASAAAEAGSAAVVACLWPVGDAAAAVFMHAFYEWLVSTRRKGRADLREGLNVGRLALRDWLRLQSGDPARLRDGRDIAPAVIAADDAPVSFDAAVSEAVQWAPFVLLGDPLFGG